eukprot:CAMPEP_0182587522 /NCGR_PEP_ID=MMETSP1324-20130603/65238_1 /TAXON_ID=236786 /ORGANISM="Florenciella sp., Strain RCC1587" /LENGTH=41 /DNA_ID= /DNA_START= /DNA_END= /DNA_ORIENTATION=
MTPATYSLPYIYNDFQWDHCAQVTNATFPRVGDTFTRLGDM